MVSACPSGGHTADAGHSRSICYAGRPKQFMEDFLAVIKEFPRLTATCTGIGRNLRAARTGPGAAPGVFDNQTGRPYITDVLGIENLVLMGT